MRGEAARGSVGGFGERRCSSNVLLSAMETASAALLGLCVRARSRQHAARLGRGEERGRRRCRDRVSSEKTLETKRNARLPWARVRPVSASPKKRVAACIVIKVEVGREREFERISTSWMKNKFIHPGSLARSFVRDTDPIESKGNKCYK